MCESNLRCDPRLLKTVWSANSQTVQKLIRGGNFSS